MYVAINQAFPNLQFVQINKHTSTNFIQDFEMIFLQAFLSQEEKFESLRNQSACKVDTHV
jgi:hypothetical protein